jgi:hypothetical protein
MHNLTCFCRQSFAYTRRPAEEEYQRSTFTLDEIIEVVFCLAMTLNKTQYQVLVVR